jgi:hypothetical protein
MWAGSRSIAEGDLGQTKNSTQAGQYSDERLQSVRERTQTNDSARLGIRAVGPFRWMSTSHGQLVQQLAPLASEEQKHTANHNRSYPRP